MYNTQFFTLKDRGAYYAQEQNINFVSVYVLYRNQDGMTESK